MIISIASGKGGTGKTTIAVNLALSITKEIPLSVRNDTSCQFLDCDVEEPNAHIFLKPDITQRESVSIPVPKVDEKKCTYCGKCQEVCAYNAIAVIKNKVLIFPELCHGCGGCRLLCPEKAIEEIGREIGITQIGKSGTIEFVNGKLNIGEAMSPPLIRAVKKSILTDKINIIDAPPGTSCPVIEAIKGSNYCILVTEPTPFGLNDLILAVEVLRKLKIPFGVVVNRADIGDKGVDNYCSKENIPVLMQIPFDRKIAEAYSTGIPMVEVIPEYKTCFLELFTKIKKLFFYQEA
ncbi:MAG: (4Fe-4S)-binding protein [Elusimicrobia bacterium CG1_02_37_114]|nr:MAG: (4Fe-4S)-binding protein [Elusimicrobia bacterium CG1_02_37_114]PIV53417.1 MAG: (4Fe-4S)-binding protein [Elusimicrobia bacterium CG02_land_8_20_14_3_00_37_13]PIZ13054.1 MAG: (4Fe-4S)-binding protein [Elusimicrobia bacterium CG_4_10_14_0_8_um_filter_37_32]